MRELDEFVEWYNAFEDSTQTARTMSERHRDYYDGNQWTAEEIAELKKRSQPIVTLNRIAPKVDFVLGMEMNTRTDPKAFPRNPGVDEKSAEAATDALRYVADVSNMDFHTSCAGQNLLIEGTCGGEVYIETLPNGEVEIKVRHIPWDRLFWDPNSRMADFSDAKYLGIVLWSDRDDAEGMYPGKSDVFDKNFTGSESGTTHDDRPHKWTHGSGKRKRVKICQVYYRDYHENYGYVWYTATYTKAGFLSHPQAVHCRDNFGRSVCPLILQSAKLDRDNDRYGMVKHLVSPQDEINKRRSKALHLLNTRQTIGDRGAVANLRQAKQELAKPDGHIEINPNSRFDIVPNQDLAQGQFQLLQHATAEIDAVSANSALTGKDPRVLSGRAIQAKQQGGVVELQLFFDALRNWKLSVYRVVWLYIQTYWTYEKWIRVSDNEESPKYVGLNQPINMVDVLRERGIEVDENMPLPEELVQQLASPVGVANDVAKIDVDIILSEANNTVDLQAEQFDQLAILASRGVPIPPDVLIMASTLRNKEQLVKMIHGDPDSPESQKQMQEQEMQKQIALKNVSLELTQKQADIEKTIAETKNLGANSAKNLGDLVQKRAELTLKALGLA